jgi:hypothetical protein
LSTVFLSELMVSFEQTAPILLETSRRQFRGTVCDVNVEGDFVVIFTPKTFGDKSSTTTVPMAEIVSVELHG